MKLLEIIKKCIVFLILITLKEIFNLLSDHVQNSTSPISIGLADYRREQMSSYFRGWTIAGFLNINLIKEQPFFQNICDKVKAKENEKEKIEEL